MARKKITILGGGMAALSTAFQLTRTDELRREYEVTVYQQGWRLGGKCAAGRNRDAGDRVEEHGLHILFGWYENTFRLIRECYEAVTGDAAAWRSAIRPYNGTVVMPEYRDGVVRPWVIKAPINNDVPGDDRDVLTSPAQYVKNIYEWTARLFGGAQLGAESSSEATRADARARLADDGDGKLGPDARLAHVGLAHRLAATIQDWKAAAEDHHLLGYLRDSALRTIWNDAHWLHPDNASLVRSSAATRFGAAETDVETALRRLRILIDFSYAVISGLTKELIVDGRHWFDLDDRDLRAWLKQHGARAETCASAPVQALYSAVFADGTVAAGTMLQVALRAGFFFKGAALYQPQGPIADVIFVPLYRTLLQRGVTFKFFHKVTQLSLDEDRQKVARIAIDRQVATQAEYDPLIEVKGRATWPTRPKYEALEGEAAVLSSRNFESAWDDAAPVERLELVAGRDFDIAVLGISLAALPQLFADAMNDPRNDAFQWMVRGILTTQTQAAQLWFDGSVSPPNWLAPVLIPYQAPFDTVAAMGHVLPLESWPAGAVRDLAYLVSALPDDAPSPELSDRGYPARQRDRVKQNLRDWLSRLAPPLWSGGDRTWSASDEAWLERQYIHAPQSLSDRYVLCLPGTFQYRLGANQSGYANLILAGDWIRTAVSAGCLEAATMAGVQAARAIDARVPKALGDWLPDPQPAGPPPPRTLVFRDGDLIAQPPIRLEVELYTFVLRADMEKLETLLAAHLGLAPPLRYRPLAPWVTLYAAQLHNHAEPFATVDEIDLGIWVPAVRVTPGPKRVLAYTPYLWVDSGWALTSGREIFGFPKQIGRLTFPRAANDAARFSAGAEVLPLRGALVEEQPIVSVERQGGGVIGEADRRLLDWTSIVGGLERVAAAGPLMPEYPLSSWALVREALSTRGLPMVFLKQVPDVSHERRACYQAIIESVVAIVPGSLQVGPLPGDFAVTFQRYESHRIVEMLGLAATDLGDGRAVARPIAQARSQFQAIVEPGTVMWKGN
jgi:uncharacterized protein with NAD-binding domain and iron-sulfur cluster